MSRASNIRTYTKVYTVPRRKRGGGEGRETVLYRDPEKKSQRQPVDVNPLLTGVRRNALRPCARVCYLAAALLLLHRTQSHLSTLYTANHLHPSPGLRKRDSHCAPY